MVPIDQATIPPLTDWSLSVLRSSRMFFCCLDLVSSYLISPRFQNIVPISLYISIEFVRTCQAAFIYYDSEMVYKGQSTVARSWNLSDDLGQVKYIFSDKTGTLTQVNFSDLHDAD
jgi:P-type E1-E2 ATPase